MARLVRQAMLMAGRLPGASLLLAAAAGVIGLFPTLSRWCEWNRDYPWEAWRWLSGHFCHWSFDHFAWDVVVFLFLGALCERRNRPQFLTCILVSALAITGATALFLPELQSYRGLSGIDSALFGWLFVELLRTALARRDRRMVAMALVFMTALGAKVAFECITSSTLFVSNSQSDFVPVPLAHAVGALAGICLNIISRGSRVRTGVVPESTSV